MDTLQENEAMQNLPFREDGTVDLMELGRRQLEQMVNQIMDWQADELRGEGNRRNGYRERRLLTPVGEITLMWLYCFGRFHEGRRALCGRRLRCATRST